MRTGVGRGLVVNVGCAGGCFLNAESTLFGHDEFDVVFIGPVIDGGHLGVVDDCLGEIKELLFRGRRWR